MISAMNPWKWSPEQQIGMLIAVVVGVCLGTVLGYVVYTVGISNPRFHDWTIDPIRRVGWVWSLLGGLAGFSIIYLMRLTRSPP
jgi:hypothetical protein